MVSEWEYFSSIDDLPFSDRDKQRVLMWFARKVWDAQQRYEKDYYCKGYDPLQIYEREGGGYTVSSYVFSFRDGGRSHVFASLADLEDGLVDELWSECDYGFRIHPNDYAEHRAFVLKSRGKL